MRTSFDTRLEWSGGPLFLSDSNKRRGNTTVTLFESPSGLLLKSGLQPLGSCGTHQETISRRPEQLYLPSDPRLEWPGEGALFEFNLNKFWGQNMGTIRVPPGHYLCQDCGPWSVRHQCKSLPHVAEYV